MIKGKKKKIVICTIAAVLILVGVMCCFFFSGGISYAAELVDGTLNAEHLYSKYALENYQLDFYVSMSGGWLPWNWGDSVGKSVMYGVYYITDALWNINTTLSSAVGSMITEAYSLDFVGSVVDTLGNNLQMIAGVSPSGFSLDGLYIKFLPWLILITGVYVAYYGMGKHESSKALSGLLSFVLIYVISAAFIAFSPNYIGSINEFSTEMSGSMLNIGTKILVSESGIEEEDSVDVIRDSLFAIQVYKPWLLLQFGTTDVDTIGQERIDDVLAVSPSSGELREEAIIKEVEEYANNNMSITKVPARFGNVLLLLVVNIVISVFVFLFIGIMILSQFLFIGFCLMLPISCLISMIAGQGGKWKQSVIKVFNTMMMRVGISLIITIAFCLSSMVYGLTENCPFLLIGFFQIIVFAGVFYKLGDFLDMINLRDNGAESLGRRIFYRPYMRGRQFAHRHMRNLGRNMRRMTSAGAAGYAGSTTKVGTGSEYINRQTGATADRRTLGRNKPGIGERTGSTLGHAVGAVTDLPARTADKIKRPIEKIADLPTNAKYAVYSVGAGFKEERAQSKENREERQERRQNTREYKQQRMAGNLDKDVLNERNGSVPEKTKKANAEYKRPVKKEQVTTEKSEIRQKENRNDLGKLPKGAVLNGQGNVRQERKMAGQREELKKMEYHAPVRAAVSAPVIREQNGKHRQELDKKTVPEKENVVRTTEKNNAKNRKKDRNSSMGELPKGAVLNGQGKPDKRKE